MTEVRAESQKEPLGAIWLASYPKSGNTWLRCLLEAYRRGGLLDINDIGFGISDSGGTVVQGVSPMPLESLHWQHELLLRPAALLNLFCRLKAPMFVKTHFANIQPDDGLPHSIPKQFTQKAIYVVRDPRSVLLSFMRFFDMPIDTAIDAMNSKHFRIGDHRNFATQLISSWTIHVTSWITETEFPVHIVRYEDLMRDSASELREVLEFLGSEVDEDRVDSAVRAAELSRLQKVEASDGFRENSSKSKFFGNGGSRWRDELSPAHCRRIEEDHRDTMMALGYLERQDAVELHTV